MEELTFQQFITEVNRTYKEEEDFYRRLARRSGLSDAAFWVLYSIETAPGPVTQTDIGSTLMLSKQTINSSIRKLAQDGYITLKHGKGRQMHIFLTDTGIELVKERIFPVIEIENKVFDSMAEEESRELLRLSRKYIEILEKNAKELLQ